jgi:hypothetical protein
MEEFNKMEPSTEKALTNPMINQFHYAMNTFLPRSFIDVWTGFQDRKAVAFVTNTISRVVFRKDRKNPLATIRQAKFNGRGSISRVLHESQTIRRTLNRTRSPHTKQQPD